MFNGFTDKTFEFFMAIRFNNNRDFFLENHDWYAEHVRKPCLDLAEALSESVRALDPALYVSPNRAVSRINRDLRFSKDKSPYRDYMWLAFRKPGEERSTALGVYFDMSDDSASYGMGFYGENKPLMRAMRLALTRDAKPFQEIARAVETRFQLHANPIRRMEIPDSIPEDLKSWYPLKGFYVEKELHDFSLLKSPALVDEIADGYRFLTPLYRYFSALVPIQEAE